MTLTRLFEIAHKVFNYTNHTIMAEALEKWDCRLVEKVVPEVYTYILMINERFIKDMYALKRTENISLSFLLLATAWLKWRLWLSMFQAI